jgi:hypothetical protein
MNEIFHLWYDVLRVGVNKNSDDFPHASFDSFSYSSFNGFPPGQLTKINHNLLITPEELEDCKNWRPSEEYAREFFATYWTYEVGDKFRLKEGRSWARKHGIIQIGTDEVLEVVKVLENFPRPGLHSLFFAWPDAFNGMLCVNSRNVEPVTPGDGSVTHPCHCSTQVLFDQGCQCGGT